MFFFGVDAVVFCSSELTRWCFIFWRQHPLTRCWRCCIVYFGVDAVFVLNWWLQLVVISSLALTMWYFIFLSLRCDNFIFCVDAVIFCVLTTWCWFFGVHVLIFCSSWYFFLSYWFYGISIMFFIIDQVRFLNLKLCCFILCWLHSIILSRSIHNWVDSI